MSGKKKCEIFPLSMSRTQSTFYYTGQCCPLYHQSATFDPTFNIFKLQRVDRNPSYNIPYGIIYYIYYIYSPYIIPCRGRKQIHDYHGISVYIPLNFSNLKESGSHLQTRRLLPAPPPFVFWGVRICPAAVQRKIVQLLCWTTTVF